MRHRYYSFDAFRIVLAFFICVISFGFPSAYGGYVEIVSGFATISFFLVSGFLVLGDPEEREESLRRAIIRSAITFAVLLIVYFAINFFYYRWIGFNIFDTFASKRLWFELIVFNSWSYPIGGTIWFVQCLLYGYIAIFIINKLKLLKYDWIFFLACIVIALLTGEFAGLIRFSFLGYNCIPATVITRSLPYLLLGMILYRKKLMFERLPIIAYVGIGLLGAVLTCIEAGLLARYGYLVYTGHFIGNGIAAAAFTVICILVPYAGRNKFTGPMLLAPKVVYYIHQPLGFLISLLLVMFIPEYYDIFSPLFFILIYGICLVIALPFGLIKLHHLKKVEQRAEAELEAAGISEKKLAQVSTPEDIDDEDEKDGEE